MRERLEVILQEPGWGSDLYLYKNAAGEARQVILSAVPVDGVTAFPIAVGGLVTVAKADASTFQFVNTGTPTAPVFTDITFNPDNLTSGQLEDIAGAVSLSGTAADLVIADVGSYFTTDNAEAALQQLGAWKASIGATTGAGLVGITTISGLAATTVQDALAEILSDFAATSSTNGASRVGIQDAGSYISGATVEAALQEYGLALSKYALTTSGNGAALIGIFDTGSIITATTVEGALQEIQARITTHISDLAATSSGKGASLIGIFDTAAIITATTVEGALAEIQARITTQIATYAATTTGNGASLIGIFDTGNIITATTVEGALQEIQARITTQIATYALTTTGNGASLIGIFDTGSIITATTVEGALQEIQARITTQVAAYAAVGGAALVGINTISGITATTVQGALAEILTDLAATGAGQGASLVAVRDAAGFTGNATVEACLAELYQNAKSANVFLPISLFNLREATAFAVSNIAGNGGLLASDTSPSLAPLNGATDGAQRVSWVATNNDQVITQVTLPADIDGSVGGQVEALIRTSGGIDAPTVTTACFFDTGDTSIGFTSDAIGSSFAWLSIADFTGADIPDGGGILTIGITPDTHATSALQIAGLRFVHGRKILVA